MYERFTNAVSVDKPVSVDNAVSFDRQRLRLISLHQHDRLPRLALRLRRDDP